MPSRNGAFVGVVLAATLSCACGAQDPAASVQDDPSASTAPPSATEARAWSPLPDAPLSARHGAHGYWVDHTFIVMGGRDTSACPPAADCELPAKPALRDGARYRPADRRWTKTADAPVPLGDGSTTSARGIVYWWLPAHLDDGKATVLAYDVDADSWDALPSPPTPAGRGWLSLAAAGDMLVAYWPTHESAGRAPDVIYDPTARTWRNLPVDPLGPSFDRSMVWTNRELILLALDLVPNPGSDEPSLYRAAAMDPATGSWRPLADSEIVGGWPTWFAVAGAVANPSLGAADGGAVNNWGRAFPHGGLLDPEANTWSPLPRPPLEEGGFLGPAAADNRAMFNGQGWLLDLVTNTWTHVAAPRDAPDEGHAVALGDGHLYTWGGVDWDTGGTLSAAGWTIPAYRP